MPGTRPIGAPLSATISVDPSGSYRSTVVNSTLRVPEIASAQVRQRDRIR
jgi:hypothetical protein